MESQIQRAISLGDYELAAVAIRTFEVTENDIRAVVGTQNVMLLNVVFSRFVVTQSIDFFGNNDRAQLIEPLLDVNITFYDSSIDLLANEVLMDHTDTVSYILRVRPYLARDALLRRVKSAKMVNILILRGCNQHLHDAKGGNVLHYILRTKDIPHYSIIRAFLRQQVDTNSLDVNSETPLLLAKRLETFHPGTMTNVIELLSVSSSF